MNNMQIDYLKEIERMFNDPKFIENERKSNIIKEKLKEKHIQKVKSYYNNVQQFEEFLKINIARHDEEWSNNCNNRGYVSYNKKILEIIFDIAFSDGTVYTDYLDEFTDTFSSNIVNYYGYYFALINGQGTVSSIYDSNKTLIYSGG